MVSDVEGAFDPFGEAPPKKSGAGLWIALGSLVVIGAAAAIVYVAFLRAPKKATGGGGGAAAAPPKRASSPRPSPRFGCVIRQLLRVQAVRMQLHRRPPPIGPLRRTGRSIARGSALRSAGLTAE